MKPLQAVDPRRSRMWREERGAAAAEFGLILPVLLLILFGIIEFGRMWNVRQTLTDAAREGARVAAVGNGIINPVTALQDSVVAIVENSARNARLDLTALTISHDQVGGGTGNPVTVNLLYDYDPLFGRWVLPSSVFQIRTFSVMRNE
jgi:Flp pilus assembly protein TadG